MRQTKATDRVIEVDHASIFCIDAGEGDPLVVLHGGPGLSMDYLLPQMQKLAQHNHVIFYDQRGCGQSTGNLTPDEISIEKYISDLEAIRVHFGFEKISLLGHSWGGLLAMRYAIAHPERVDKLILSNSSSASSEEFNLFLSEWNTRTAPYRDEIDALRESDGFAKGAPEVVEPCYSLIFGTYCYDPIKANLLNLKMSPQTAKKGNKVFEILQQSVFLRDFDFHCELRKLDIPTLVIHGDADVIPPHTAEHLHKSIPNSQYILLKNCGHFPYVETPSIYFSQLKTFLTK